MLFYLFTKRLVCRIMLMGACAFAQKISADTHIQRILKKPYLCSRRKRYFLHDKREIMENRGKILIIDDNEDVLFALNLLFGALCGEGESHYPTGPYRIFYDYFSAGCHSARYEFPP